MNCKPGDLAIVVPPGFSENLGKVVRCIELCKEAVAPDGIPLKASGPIWVIDRPLVWLSFTFSSCRDTTLSFANDETLMPISPPDNFKELEDELWLKQHAPVQA